MTLRNKLAIGATGLALLVGGYSLSGCESNKKDLVKYEKIERQNYETHTDKYFRNAYNKINLEELTDDEKAVFVTANIKDMPKEQREFAKKHLPYVNLKAPNSRDLMFLIHYEELIDMYKHYKSIDVKNLSSEEKNTIKKFREDYPSGKLTPSKESEDEKRLLETFGIFVDLDNMSDRDIIFVDGIMGAIAASMMQNMN